MLANFRTIPASCDFSVVETAYQCAATGLWLHNGSPPPNELDKLVSARTHSGYLRSWSELVRQLRMKGPIPPICISWHHRAKDAKSALRTVAPNLTEFRGVNSCWNV